MVYERFIQQGAEVLDKVMPGWELGIDVAELNLDSSFKCVLGQLYEDYDVALAMFVDHGDSGLSDADRWSGYNRAADWAREHAFLNPPLTEHEEVILREIQWSRDEEASASRRYSVLTEEWAQFIKDRLDAGISI